MTISSILINYYSHLKIAVDIFVNLVKNLGYFLFQHLVTLQFSPLAGFGTIISWTVVLIKQLQRVRSWNNQAWSSLVKGDEGCFGQSGKLCCLWQPGPPPKKIVITQQMHGIILCRLGFSADPFVHLLLLKSSTNQPILGNPTNGQYYKTLFS